MNTNMNTIFFIFMNKYFLFSLNIFVNLCLRIFSISYSFLLNSTLSKSLKLFINFWYL